ncbi:CCHC-type domain-containing protein [Trichonephila clavipes]|nr:CCHC-type domain-containing protein [Trichonephila clavipes]
MAKSRSGRSKKRRFTGNRYTIRATINENDETSELNSTESASAKSWNQAIQVWKFSQKDCLKLLKDNRIVSWTTLIFFFAIVCCPDLLFSGLGTYRRLCQWIMLTYEPKVQNCSFFKGFPTTEKMKGSCLINSSIVLGLRIIGKGFSAGKNYVLSSVLPFLSKLAFRNQERKLLKSN